MSNNTPQFSSVDLAGEEKLAEFYQRRLGRPAVTGILAPGGAIAKVIGSNQPVKLLEIGPERKEWTKSFSNLEIDDSFERQVRAFGISGQLRIQDLRIGIVGLGGTGSVVLQQLAYLGARDFVLMDADVVESTNLNRLVGANPMSVGIPKVAVARDLGQSINPKAHFQLEHSSINVMSAAKKLCDTDFIFCCTDSHGSRAIIGQLAYQYLIPTIDMGVVIVSKAEHITHIAGRVQMLAPSLGCFACGNLLDPDAVRHDLMTTFERQADPYFLGQGEPQPSVISLNSTIASLAITMFLAAVAGVPSRPRFQIYNGIAGTVRAGVVEPQPRCVVCSSSGALGKADEWTLPARLA